MKVFALHGPPTPEMLDEIITEFLALRPSRQSLPTILFESDDGDTLLKRTGRTASLFGRILINNDEFIKDEIRSLLTAGGTVTVGLTHR